MKKNKDYTDDDLIDYVNDINYIQMLNYIAKKLETKNDNSVVSGDVIHCTYDNYDNLREGLGVAAEIFGFFAAMGSGKAELASTSADLATFIDR